MERDDAQSGLDGVGVQPSERQLIGRRENREGSGIALPRGDEIGESDRELQRRVRDLAHLRGWREVSAANEVDLLSGGTLEMRHISMIVRAHTVAPPCYGRGWMCLRL
jgi:hypothetical protein